MNTSEAFIKLLKLRSAPGPLIWLAAALVIGSGALTLASLLHQRSVALEAGERLTESMARVIAEQTSRTIQIVDQRLQLTASGLTQLHTRGALNEASARALLRAQLAELPFVRAIWVVGANSLNQYDSDVGNLGVRMGDRAYFQAHLSNPQLGFFIGKPIRSRTTGTWLLSASRRLSLAAGRFDGVIVAAIEPRYFDQLWRTVDLGPGGSIALLHRDGTMMMRSPFDERVMGKNFHEAPLFSTHLPQSSTGSYQDVSRVDQQMRQFAYRTLSTQPELLVVVGLAVDTILAPWRRLSALALVIWAIASTAIMALSVMLNRVWRQQVRAGRDRLEVFERITDAFVALDRHWNYTYVNSKAGQLFGRDPAGLIGRHIWTEFPEGVGQSFHITYALAMTTQWPMFVEEYYPPYQRWFENRIYPSPGGLSIYFHDVTERKLAQEQLRQSEASLADAQESAPLGSWERDRTSRTGTWSAENSRQQYRAPALGAPSVAG